MKVLLATDGSEAAGLAIELVAGIAWPPSTAIRIVEAIETDIGLFGGPWPAVALAQADALEADLVETARATVEAAQARIERPGLDVDSRVLRGRPATTVVDAAAGTGADLIVVGSRGHGTIESMLLGSVSAEVVDHARIPVLVARRERLDRVVVAWDGSDCARAAVDVVKCWPILAAPPIHVVSVADFQVPWWTGFPETGSPETLGMYEDAAASSRSSHEKLASALVDELRGAGLTATSALREGDAAGELIAAAQELQADLIVMGTHGRTGLRRLVLGSVARNVLQHARCSVMIVREPATR